MSRFMIPISALEERTCGRKRCCEVVYDYARRPPCYIGVSYKALQVCTMDHPVIIRAGKLKSGGYIWQYCSFALLSSVLLASSSCGSHEKRLYHMSIYLQSCKKVPGCPNHALLGPASPRSMFCNSSPHGSSGRSHTHLIYAYSVFCSGFWFDTIA